MWDYPVELTDDTNGTILVSLPDIPEVHTFGDDREEALIRAVDALETALAFYVDGRRDLPLPSAAAGRPTVTPSAQVCIKLDIYAAMRHGKIGKAELARRLGWHLPQVDRLLDLRHATRIDLMEAALAALGKRIEIIVRDAA
ncbi:MAG: type II toxin-antitoxin system HicB family antitoxin [Nitrospirae bacterium]|nr:type II toxin-antitoxin system HicB family antitoxin [Magnetococcales bacterium]HAT50151.1 HicB family protein [Alphaproteobacteria bacterium]